MSSDVFILAYQSYLETHFDEYTLEGVALTEEAGSRELHKLSVISFTECKGDNIDYEFRLTGPRICQSRWGTGSVVLDYRIERRHDDSVTWRPWLRYVMAKAPLLGNPLEYLGLCADTEISSNESLSPI